MCVCSVVSGEGNGTPLQYSCLENPMDGGAWQAAVHGVAKSRIRLSDFTFTFHFRALEKEMATHSCGFLPGESQGRGSLVGCRLWGRTESDMTAVTQQQQFSRVQLFSTPQTVAHQVLLSMEFPRQEYQSGLPFPSLEDLPNTGIEHASLALAGRFFTTASPGKTVVLIIFTKRGYFDCCFHQCKVESFVPF